MEWINRLVKSIFKSPKTDNQGNISKYRIIAENAGDVIWLLDLKTFRTKYVSPSVEHLRGFTPQEAMQQTLDQVLTPESYKEAVAHLHSWVESIDHIDPTYRIQTHELDQMCRDGSVVHTEVVTTILTDEKGKAKEILGVSRNINDRKKAEERIKEAYEKLEQSYKELIAKEIELTERNRELQQSEERLNQQNEILRATRDALSESDERFKHIFYTSPDAISISRCSDSIYVEVNNGFLSMTGYTRDEIIGKTSEEVGIWQDPHDRIKLLDDLTKNNVVNEMEAVFKLKNGQTRSGLISSQIINLQGKAHIVSVAHDIDNLKKVEEELRLAKEKAEESDRLKTVFLQNMSHEIRTPMNAIMGFSDLMEIHIDNKEKIKFYCTILKKRSHDLLGIINELLDISRIEAGQLKLRVEECDINLLMNDIHSLFLHKYQQSHPAINFVNKNQLQNESISFNTDLVKLKQALNNLIDNAFKFTKEGQIEFGVNRNSKSELEFYVSDTGIGIPVEKQELIFERFRQIDEGSTRPGGAGLGLTIVKGLVNLLGGNITVESIPNEGSTFRFTIKNQRSSSHERNGNLNTQPKWTGKSILIVEDDHHNAEYLKELLSPSGATISHLTNGYEAIEIVKKQENVIDLILMDIRLPGIDGLETTREIRKHNKLIRIMAQTAHAATDDKHNALRAGCNDYISKPINQYLLMRKIDEQLK